MATDIHLPILGESITTAVLTRWLKKIGDPVKRGDEIAELETDKASVPLESPATGVLLCLWVEEGATLHIGERLASVGLAGETLPSSQAPVAQPPVPSDQTAMNIPAAESTPLRRVSPAARKLAKDLRIDLDAVMPSVPGERITSEDVQRYAAREPGKSPKILPVPSHLFNPGEARRVMARRMAESARDIPQFSVSMDIEMNGFQAILEQARGTLDIHPTVTALLAYLTGRAILQHPLLNAIFDPEGIKIYDTVNLAVAVASGQGLAAPVIYGVEKLGLTEISGRLREISEKARAAKLGLDDLSGSTFTLSNLGMYGVSQFVPLVNPPQSAILGAGAIRPMVVPSPEGGTRHIQIMTVAVSADHRVLDGAEAAQFLSTLKMSVESCQFDEIHL